MDAFAFIIHPIDPKRDVARKYPFLGKVLPEGAIDFLTRVWPPLQLSHITGARSQATGKEIEGWLIAVPYTPHMMLALPPKEVYRKIVAAGRLAEKLGARVLGLGAYTSVVGDGGVTIARELDIAVTSGDSYTAAISIKAAIEAAQCMGITVSETTVAIVGASGAIGGVVSQLLAPRVGRLLLVGRKEEPLHAAAEMARASGCENVTVSINIADVRAAQLVITVTSSGGDLLQPDMLRRGAVVCDVSRPRDVSKHVSEAREDVLVIDGGLVRVPGDVDFGFDYGLPGDLTYGCMAETMTLAFEGLFMDYSVGKQLTVSQVQEIDVMAARHGFELAALRSFEHKLDDAQIQRVRMNALAGGG